MNINTAALITKGWCIITGGMAAAIAAGITQIDVTEFHGVSTKIFALFLGSYSVGCNLLVAFLSQSFGTWNNERKTNGTAAAVAADQPKP
jgi:hypothetical protein